VATALDGRVRLLVFDNCEHVLDAAADMVSAILDRSSSVKILATSREGLGAVAEQIWPVRSLEVDSAVVLFGERARSVAPGFSTDDVVAEICRRLDGIPLAIELAASRMASMTAIDVRDRLDDRFKLLVGARRNLERHQTLRHAVQWSYDLLDDAERKLLDRCSVFAGGFDLGSACAIAGSDDEFATLDLLDALVRKSLLVADRSSGHARFAMLETIRQFAEEQLVRSGDAHESRTAHARHFAARETAIMTVWDGPRQLEAYEWFKTEIANLRSGFRWATDEGDLDTAAAIASLAGWLGVLIENLEPLTWAEELVVPARAVDHPRLASLCAVASLCFLLGRVDDALEYSRTGQLALEHNSGETPSGAEQFWLGAVYSAIPESDLYARFYQRQLERGRDKYGLAEAFFATALTWSDRTEEALSVAPRLIELADTTTNPFVASYALMTYGMVCSADDPLRALDALRRGLKIAKDTGNRSSETYLAMSLAIGNYHDSGNITQLRASLGLLATFLDHRGRAKSAATLAGFAGVLPTAAPSVPEFAATLAHLRDVLGEQTYATSAHDGTEMSMATAVTFAYDEIDRVRHELEQLP
jgi:predicted ATPase